MPFDLLITLSGPPLLLFFALFAATFVAEDAATIAAGLLVAQTGADPVVAVMGVISGTAIGDLALYALGRWGAGTKPGRRLSARADVQRAIDWVAGRALLLAFAARFVPGTRLPVYTASGMVAAPFVPFAAIIALTTPVWTGSLFAIARVAGEAGAHEFTNIALAAGTTVTLIAIARWLRRVVVTRTGCGANLERI